MRILLVRVEAETRYMQAMYDVVRMEPLSLEYLGAAVRKDHDVKVFDMRLEGSWAGLRATIEAFKPHVVGTGGDTCEANACKKVLALAKEIDPEILTVVGGIHATCLPEDFNTPGVDVVCINEGVFAFKELVEALDGEGGDPKAVPGLAWNEGGAQRRAPERRMSDLDLLPMPDRSLTADVRGRYKFSLWGKSLALMRYTQGCIGTCDFCPSWALTDRRYLRRSVDSMIEELRTIDEPYVYFVCEESLLNTKRSLELAKRIEEEGIRKGFGMPLRADTIAKKPHVIEAWARIGLEDAVVGIEQASDEDLESREKTTTVRHNIEAMKVLKANGVACTGSMFFRPDFGKEEFDRLVEHCLELQVDCPQFFIMTPIPGTKLFHKVRDDLVEHNFDLWDFNHAVLPTKLPLHQFYELYMYAYGTHLHPATAAFYQKKFSKLTPAEMDEEMQGMLGFREVFGTLHLDHEEYSHV